MRSVSEALRAHEVSEAAYVSGPSVPGAGRAPGKVDSACEHRPRGRRLRSRAVNVPADADSVLMREVLLQRSFGVHLDTREGN